MAKQGLITRMLSKLEVAGVLIEKTLQQIAVGEDVMNIEGITSFLIKAIRNNGIVEIAMIAVSAVDDAL